MAGLNMSAELLDCKAQLQTLEIAMQQLDQRLISALD